MMQTQVIRFLDSEPGESVEAKAYGVIAAAYDESGFEPFDIDTDVPIDLGIYVRRLFRVVWASSPIVDGEHVEWEVVIEGDDDDIEELKEILDYDD